MQFRSIYGPCVTYENGQIEETKALNNDLLSLDSYRSNDGYG